MARPKVGEGSEVISVCLPKELADQIRSHSNRSALITDLLYQNIDQLGEVDYSKVDEYYQEFVARKVKVYMARAIVDAVEELSKMSLPELTKAAGGKGDGKKG
jgi:hypothetical protein